MIKQGRPTKQELKRKIIYMVDVENKNFTEVAKKLNTTKQNVKHHYDTGKKLSTDEGVDKSK